MGELVATRPREVLLAGLVPLILLAAFFPFLKPGYDPRGTLPDSTPSNQGFDAIARHFPVNAILPDWIVVTAPHDMREVESLAALEQIARQVSRVPGIASVSGITRPLGDPLTEATLAYQAGIVGDQLKKAAGEAGASNPSELTDGLTQLGDASSQISNGADVAHSGSKQLAQGADKLVDGLTQLSHATSQAQGGSTQLRDGARALANGLEDAAQQSQQLLSALQLVHSGLTKSLGCSLDPVCNQSRTGLQQIVTLVESELIPGMRQAAQGARQLADGTTTLASGLTQIDDGMKQARAGAAKLADGQTQLADGLGKLSGATGQLAQGASQAGSQIGAETTKSLDGLSKAAKALIELGKAKDGPGAGFYLPPSVLKSPEFATVSQLFMSPDGRTARFAVLGEANAFSQEAMDRSHDVLAAAQSAVKATALASAQIQATGIPPINADLQKYSSRDFGLLAITSLLAVLFILIVLLRSLVGPILLLLSVVLSYAAAVGLATLAWQMILGSSVDSVVPVAAFILLVAVGSDYNMLLMMRILEESPDGSREGVGRALRMTGGVITAAGIIFAGSMLAMMAGTVSMLRQMGFTVGIGLLLDTFVVRSMVVPALASLLRSGIWWPRLRRRA